MSLPTDLLALLRRWLNGGNLGGKTPVTFATGASVLSGIDDEVSAGLDGTNNSLGYRVAEIETHLHSFEHFYGAAVTPSGETHVADPLGPGVNPFVIDAGDNDWGAWVQIIGSEDMPFTPGAVKFDLNELAIITAERDETYFVQIAFGEDAATALAAFHYLSQVFHPASNQVDAVPVVVQCRRQGAGTKAWARCLCLGQDTGTLSFYYGFHEYQG